MKRILIPAAIAAAVLSASAHAADAKAGEALAKSHGCFACHAMDKKLIGPGFRQIAERYRKDKGAETSLAQKVKAGGKGVWGDIPMPPNAHVKDQDIQAMVKWMTSLQ